jgi:cathepsin X
MKAEIYKNGPVSCAIEVTDKFEEYKAGEIYSENLPEINTNHVVSVVGWGKDPKSGEEYWVGRNSWGTYWGDYGFFLIKMHSDNLGIEDYCNAGTPSLNKPKAMIITEFIQ